MKFKKQGILLFSVLSLTVWQHAYADENDDSSDTETVSVSGHSKDAIGNMLLQSVSLMGIPYRWGGNTPETGMDCSGFIRYVFKKSLGINLPRTAAEMARIGKRVGIDELEPGDLVFFNTRRGSNTHIGIYIGNNKFIQAPHTGTNIQVTELSGWYRSHFNGAKRIIQENEDDDGNTVLEGYQDVRDEALPVSVRHGRKHYRHGRHGTKVKVAKKGRKVAAASVKKRTTHGSSHKKKRTRR